MAKRILWLSRHRPAGSQLVALRRLFGADVVVDNRDIGNAEDAAEAFRLGGYCDLVAVVPLSTLDHLCRQGLTPLWSEAVEERDQRRVEFRGADGRGYRFDRFRRVKGVSLNLAPVQPDSRVLRVLRVTRHEPQAAELAALRQLFGREVEVATRETAGRLDAGSVVELAIRERADEVVLVAPYSVFDTLCRSGKRPLYALFADEAFVGLFRVQGVKIEFEELS